MTFNIPITQGLSKTNIFPLEQNVIFVGNDIYSEAEVDCGSGTIKIDNKLKTQTVSEYNQVIAHCKELFKKKTLDYGTAWRILRLSSITDQIFIKAQRIRSIQEKGNQKVNDPIVDEFVGIINYCLIALIQISYQNDSRLDIPYAEFEPLYDKWVEDTRGLLENKNHDYGEAWRDMRVSSMTDIILMKLYRVKQIEDNQGMTVVSEGIEANYQDMINYAVFCLIKLNYHA